MNDAELRRGMGYVIQHAGLFPHRTVLDNIGDRAAPARLGQGEDPGSLARAARARRARAELASATRPSCPVASSSASAWPGRSRPTRR